MTTPASTPNSPRIRPTRLFLFLALFAPVALFAAACVAPNPPPGTTVSSSWGSNIQPKWANVPYGNDPAQVLDIYQPAEGGNRGILIMVHGGAFTEGSRNNLMSVRAPVIRQTHRGFAVVNIDYRLTKGNTNLFPTAVQDVAAATRWVQANGTEYGLNTSKVILVGHSAGATLAGLVATAANHPSPVFGSTPRVSAWVGLAGIYNFFDPAVGTLVHGWLGSARWESGSWRTAASVNSYLDVRDPPAYLAHGANDTIIPTAQTNDLTAAAVSRGVRSGVWLDIIDGGASASCRNHDMGCGIATPTFDMFLDKVVDGSIS